VTRCYNCGLKTHQLKECPDLDKGPKCFARRSCGHRSTECPKREFVTESEVPKASVNNDNNNTQVYQVNATSYDTRVSVCKEIKVQGTQTLALIDTGCDLNLCRSSFKSSIGDVKTVGLKIGLKGPAGTLFFTEEKFTDELSVNDSTYTVEVYSVPDEDIMCDFILGRSLFQTNAELRIRPGIVEIN
jgi:hypothetical protein